MLARAGTSSGRAAEKGPSLEGLSASWPMRSAASFFVCHGVDDVNAAKHTGSTSGSAAGGSTASNAWTTLSAAARRPDAFEDARARAAASTGSTNGSACVPMAWVTAASASRDASAAPSAPSAATVRSVANMAPPATVSAYAGVAMEPSSSACRRRGEREKCESRRK